MSSTLHVIAIRGRMFDAQGRCNTSDHPLVATVKSDPASHNFLVTITFREHGALGPFVTIFVPMGARSPHQPLTCCALLYNDLLDYVYSDSGRTVYDPETNKPVRAPKIVLSGPLEGARLWPGLLRDSDEQIRVDCDVLPPFWLETDFRIE